MAVTPNVAPFINVTFWVTGQYGTVRPDHTHVGVDIATASAGGSKPLYSIFDGDKEALQKWFKEDKSE